MTNATHRIVRRIEAGFPLSEDERHALTSMPMMERHFLTHHDIVHEGDQTPACCAVLNGFVCRQKIVGSGARQIMAIHVPGDIPDIHSLHLKVMDHTLSALS